MIGEAETGEEAVRLAEELHPDVILMDIYMPQEDGLQAAKEIRTRFPEITIVMLQLLRRGMGIFMRRFVWEFQAIC